MKTMYAGVLVLFLAACVSGQRRGDICFDRAKIFELVEECLNITQTTDSQPPPPGAANEFVKPEVSLEVSKSQEDSGEGPGGNGGGRPGRRPGGDHHGRRPGRVHGGRRRGSCIEQAMSGVQNFSTPLDFGAIKDNLVRIANPDKLTDLQDAVDKCSSSYEAEQEAREIAKQNRTYRRCFKTELRALCRRPRPTPSPPQPDVGGNPDAGGNTNPGSDAENCVPGSGVECATAK